MAGGMGLQREHTERQVLACLAAAQVKPGLEDGWCHSGCQVRRRDVFNGGTPSNLHRRVECHLSKRTCP